VIVTDKFRLALCSLHRATGSTVAGTKMIASRAAHDLAQAWLAASKRSLVATGRKSADLARQLMRNTSRLQTSRQWVRHSLLFIIAFHVTLAITQCSTGGVPQQRHDTRNNRLRHSQTSSPKQTTTTSFFTSLEQASKSNERKLQRGRNCRVTWRQCDTRNTVGRIHVQAQEGSCPRYKK
jgi:hypothetical protein